MERRKKNVIEIRAEEKEYYKNINVVSRSNFKQKNSIMGLVKQLRNAFSVDISMTTRYC